MPMDRSAVQAIVDANLKSLAEALGVSHWTINVKIGPCADRESMAACSLDPDYNSAHITLDPECMDDEAELVLALVHELGHIVLAPWRVYREAVVQHLVPGSAEAKVEDRIYTHFLEQTMVTFERLWKNTELHWRKRIAAERTAEKAEAPA